MRIFKKPRFEWNMPPEFLRTQSVIEAATSKWWRLPAVIGCIGAGAWIGWWIKAKLTGEAFSGLDLLIPAIGAGVISFGLHRFAGSFQSFKVLLDDGDDRLHIFGNQWVRCPYSTVASFEWRENREFTTLVLHLNGDKKPLLIGVPLNISREAISQFLSEKGVAPKTP